MTTNWLQLYLSEAVDKKLCTKVYCTTCGATEFRRGVLNALARTKAQRPQQKIDRTSVLEIAQALSEVTPDIRSDVMLQDAVRCLLMDLWTGMPIFDKPIEGLLVGSWAGNILQDMKKHHETRAADRKAKEEYEDPVNVQKRREEKKRVKQEQHQMRLSLKKERDKIWRETQT